MPRPAPAPSPPGPRRSGDVVYDQRCHPAVVLHDADPRHHATVDVMVTVGEDRGRRTEVPLDGLRLLTGHGAAQRCQWARDFVWLTDPRALRPRPRTEVAAAAAAAKAAGHTCADPDVCTPVDDHQCGTTAAHLRALRIEWQAGH